MAEKEGERSKKQMGQIKAINKLGIFNPKYSNNYIKQKGSKHP